MQDDIIITVNEHSVRNIYYARKKLPDPPIINTTQHTYFRIDFQRPYNLDRFCSRYMHGLAYEMACSLTYK